MSQHVKQRREQLLEMPSWDAPGNMDCCPHTFLLPGKKTLPTKKTPALHEDTDLLMDCYVCIFNNKSFFPLAFYEIYTYAHRVEYSSSSPTELSP